MGVSITGTVNMLTIQNNSFLGNRLEKVITYVKTFSEIISPYLKQQHHFIIQQNIFSYNSKPILSQSCLICINTERMAAETWNIVFIENQFISNNDMFIINIKSDRDFGNATFDKQIIVNNTAATINGFIIIQGITLLK